MTCKEGSLYYFLTEMNKLARNLQLNNTNFSNVHGLPNRSNRSTAHDICKLAIESL